MGDLLYDIVAWMEGLPPLLIYGTILAIAYIENVIPPIPGDMIVVFGGYLVGLGRVDFIPVVLLATVGGALGFLTMYRIGGRIGERVLDRERMRWIPKESVHRVRRWLHRYGYGVVAANRFLSGARSVISLMVGVAEMPLAPVALWATVSAAIWTTLLTYLGYVVGDQWEVVGIYLRKYGAWMTGLLVAGFVAYWAVRIWRRWRGTSPR